MVLVLFLILWNVPQAQAQNLRNWVNEENLTGDWGGKRTELVNRGMLFTIQYWTNLAGNPTGGLEQGFTYTDQVNLSTDFDMEKLMKWKGGKLHVVFNNRVGTSLSAEDIGNKFPVQQLFGGGERFRLVELSVEQSFADNRINIRGGRYPNDDFGTTPMYCLFMSQAFCGYPQGLGQDVNLPYFPASTWSGRVQIQPNSAFFVQFGAYEVNPAQNDASGFDWSTKGATGVAFMNEFWYVRGGKSGQLPGHYKIGIYHDTSDDGKTGAYLLVDQTVLAAPAGRGTAGVPSGLTLLGGVTYGDPDKTPLKTFAFGAVIANGLISARPFDTQGISFSVGHFSPGTNADREMVLEIHYGFQVTRWFSLQPNLQWILDPAGSGEIPDALVLGVQTVLDI